MDQFTVWYRCKGRPSGTHSGFKTLERAEGEARSAVFGVWSSADEATVTDGADRVVLRLEADDHGPGCDGPLNCVCGTVA